MSHYEHPDVQYLRIAKDILDNGDERMDRTGTGTKALFGREMRFHMDDGFPALTTKRLAFRSVVGELLWMLSGDNDNNHLRALGVHIWDGNANAPYWTPKAKFEGDAGRNYSIQWRHWKRPDGTEVDQIKEVIERIKAKPADRRLIFTGWNAGEVEETSLPACHAFAQFFVRGGELSVAMYQRSCDMFLGVPFNMAQYGLILSLFAQMTGLKPGEFLQVLGDVHLYLNHLDQAREQIGRDPYPQPTLWLNPDLRSLQDVEDKYHELLDRAGPDNKPKPLKMLEEVARLENYQFHPTIEAEMSA
jgi:thymidylate synthase